MGRIGKLFLTISFLLCFASTAPAQGTGTTIRYGPSVPTTCVSATGQVFEKTAGNVGLYECSRTNNIWSRVGCPVNMVCTGDYGVASDAKYVADAVFTMGSGTVTSAAGLFTAADVGKTCFGTNAQADITWGTSVVVMPQCTITSYTSANQVGTNQTATASTSATEHLSGYFVWGTLTGNDTAIENAWVAAETAGKPLYLCGDTLVASAHFNTYNAASYGLFSSAAGTRRGYSIIGCGSTEAWIIPVPNFDPAPCTGGASGASCFLGVPNVWLYGWSIIGFGQSILGSGFANKTLVEMRGSPYSGLNFRLSDMQFMGWGDQSPSTTVGVRIGEGTSGFLSGGMISDSIFESFGYKTAYIDTGSIADTLEITNTWFAPFTGRSIQVHTGNVSCTNCAYGLGVVYVENGSRFTDTNGRFSWGQGLGEGAFRATGSGSYIKLIGTYADTKNGSSVTAWSNTGGTIEIASSTILNSAIGATNALYSDGGSIIDACGNTFGPINPASVAGFFTPCGGPAGSIGISAQLSGASACEASKTLYLFPYGQNASVTCSTATAETPIGGYVAYRAGTLQLLTFTAGTGGVAGDAITVYKNGSTTTITCTYGTGTSCSDNTHTVSVAAGDYISFAITTGAMESTKTPVASVVLF